MMRDPYLSVSYRSLYASGGRVRCLDSGAFDRGITG